MIGEFSYGDQPVSIFYFCWVSIGIYFPLEPASGGTLRHFSSLELKRNLKRIWICICKWYVKQKAEGMGLTAEVKQTGYQKGNWQVPFWFPATWKVFYKFTGGNQSQTQRQLPLPICFLKSKKCPQRTIYCHFDIWDNGKSKVMKVLVDISQNKLRTHQWNMSHTWWDSNCEVI